MGRVNTSMASQLVAGVLCMVVAGYAVASPSGLNNIPTGDVAPEKVLVLQAWGTFADGSTPGWVVGAKYGLFKGIEIGVDSSVSSDDVGPLTLQGKYQIPAFGDSLKVQPLVGVANVSADTDEAGEIDPYLLLTFDVEILRFHLGYSFQSDNFAAFGGLDKTLQVMEHDVTLRADIRQVSDGDEFLGSVGVLCVLPHNLVFEGWGSFPSADGAEVSLTAKLNYVVSF